jgi:hypothetical protein
MSVREIVEYAKGRLPTKSKTPDTVVARDLSMDIKRKGDESLFCRTAPGRYTMRALATANTATNADRTAPATDMVASAINKDRAGTISASSSSKSATAPATTGGREVSSSHSG